MSITLCLFLSMTSSYAQESWVGSWSTSPVEFSIQNSFGNSFKDFGLYHLTFKTVFKLFSKIKKSLNTHNLQVMI